MLIVRPNTVGLGRRYVCAHLSVVVIKLYISHVLSLIRSVLLFVRERESVNPLRSQREHIHLDRLNLYNSQAATSTCSAKLTLSETSVYKVTFIYR